MKITFILIALALANVSIAAESELSEELAETLHDTTRELHAPLKGQSVVFETHNIAVYTQFYELNLKLNSDDVNVPRIIGKVHLSYLGSYYQNDHFRLSVGPSISPSYLPRGILGDFSSQSISYQLNHGVYLSLWDREVIIFASLGTSTSKVNGQFMDQEFTSTFQTESGFYQYSVLSEIVPGSGLMLGGFYGDIKNSLSLQFSKNGDLFVKEDDRFKRRSVGVLATYYGLSYLDQLSLSYDLKSKMSELSIGMYI